MSYGTMNQTVLLFLIMPQTPILPVVIFLQFAIHRSGKLLPKAMGTSIIYD